jgi:uncharacterized protein (TIGR03083 family)
MSRVQDCFAIGTRQDLDAVETGVISLFLAQRRRLLETARTFTDDEWASPTRCSEWDAHQLVIHVDGATDGCRMTLTGEYAVFDGGFSPNEGPKQFVDMRAAEPIPKTLEQFDSAITRAQTVLEAQRGLDPPPTVTALWGAPIDWRLFVMHFFFDGWIHERDLLLPMGRKPAVVDAEVRLAAAYSLHLAAVVSGLMGVPLDATLRLDGPGAATFGITANRDDVLITVAPFDDAAGPGHGDVAAVTDALTGRIADLGAALDAPPDVVDALSCMGAFLRA